MCCLLAAAAYLPALNNGFIADDYVILKRVEILKSDPLYLFHVPPENFRFVSYLIFGSLKAIAGYRAWIFYAFNIGLHLTNVVLLFRILQIVLADESAARLAALLFAVFQAPQEAIMWLAAMNETTQFFFAALTLLAWWRKRYVAATAAYACALFSKESALIVPLFVVLLDRHLERPFLWRKYLLLLVPAAAFFAIFLLTVSNNFMLTSRSYALGPQALLVLVKTIHRLLWPWFYIFATLVLLSARKLMPLPAIVSFLALIGLSMAPYMFIAFQTSLPSRQLYLASAVLTTMFAVLLQPLGRKALAKIAVIGFLAFNIGYLWLRKDAQFEQRAAPTTELVRVLRQRRPQNVIVMNFAYPLPEIATSAVFAVPGWSPSQLSLDPNGACDPCVRLKWIRPQNRYEVTNAP